MFFITLTIYHYCFSIISGNTIRTISSISVKTKCVLVGCQNIVQVP